MKKPRMFICVGAQKAGTTWLNDYLTVQSNLCFNYKNEKELHLWNCFFNKKLGHHRRKIELSVNALLREKSCDKFDKKREKISINSELFDHTFNPNIFLNKAFIECQKQKIPLCDFTPNYSIMSAANFENMKNHIEKKFDLKILFLMRDPINRIYSWLKHKKRIDYERSINNQKSALVYDENFYSNVLDDCLKRNVNFKNTFFYRGSNYPKIIDNLQRAFRKNQIKFYYYEKLFTEETIISICDFLEIDYKVPEFNIFKNQDKNNINISLRERTILLNNTMDIYKEMYSRYKDIPKEWGVNRIRVD